MKVIKRDGTIQPYDSEKIQRAIRKAHGQELGHDIIKLIENRLFGTIDKFEKHYSINEIQTCIEYVLMEKGYYETARNYITYRIGRDDKRCHRAYDVHKIPDDVEVPWGELGYITYKRTYARMMENEGRQEEYRDTILRILAACQSQLKVGFSNDELNRAYKYMMKLKGSVAGRFLWQLGTPTVDKLGLMSLQNCAFTVMDNPIKSFTWIFDSLMLGVGVGFNIQRENIGKIPCVMDMEVSVVRKDTKDADYIIPDSREGWVFFLEKVLEAYFVRGRGFSYSTILIRGAGSPIRGFGGVASGPEDLVRGITNICDILGKRRGCRLSSVDVLDIVNIIASVVVAGNVRRSALIAIGDCDDIEYLNAKRWDLGNIPNWRCMSNNSVVCDDVGKLPVEFWEGYKGNGEPYGLINLKLVRRIGRIKDGELYPDPDVVGFNPCAEQPLNNFETCCLAEVYLCNIETYDELRDIATILYRICKHSLLLGCHQEDTAEIVHRNMRMGIGITGYMMSCDEQKGWLSGLYEYLREYDAMYSAKHGMNRSIKMTTVKPSGTLSLLAGTTPGAHPGIYQYFIRRIRIASNSPLVDVCRAHGYRVEYQYGFDGMPDMGTSVVEFPCKYPEGTTLANDMTAIKQLETIKHLQTVWSDNGVSITIYYRKEELDGIREWLCANYVENIKSVSFLLHNEHGFKQAPFEEITELKYNEMKKGVRPIVSQEITDDMDDTLECSKGVCPVR
jgi:ribonucleoside-triphosphate reductase (thioredoxin)